MADDHDQNALDSATPQSRERAGAPGAPEHPGEGPAIVFEEGEDSERQIDGGADTGPATNPEGATPHVPRTSGDPLADAHEARERERRG